MERGVIDSLEAIVGSEHISDKSVDCTPYIHTQSPGGEFFRRAPEVVVMPQNTEQVSRIMSLANRSRTPVFLSGGRTSQFGINIAREGGIMIDMTLMDKIVEIDEERMLVIAQGGCSVYEIMHQLEKKNLRYPIGAVFLPSVQIGACVSTNMTGDFMNRVGRLGEILLGLEVVLPDGRVITLGSGANPFGYGHFSRYMGISDLMGIFVNAAGTMGVVTKVVIRVVPKPEVMRYISYGWPRNRAKEVAQLHYWLQRYGIYDIHLFNRFTCIEGIKAGYIDGISTDTEFIPLIIQDAQSEEEMKIKEREVRGICKEYGGKENNACEMIMGPPEYRMWQCQLAGEFGSCAPSFFYIPTLKFPETYDLFESTCKKYKLWNEENSPCWLSWADRNNMNPYPLVRHIPTDPGQDKRFKGWWYDFHRELARRGAVNVVTGPSHPREFLEGMGSAYELVKEIKRCIDPNNILNPGVLF